MHQIYDLLNYKSTAVNIDIAILTPTEIEYNAVKQHLLNLKEHRVSEGLYEIGNFVGKIGNISIVIQQTNKLNSNMAVTTERIINLFNPKMILLVGIGGGIKDVKVGEIVVAKEIYAYESVKETDDGQKGMPKVRSFNPKSLDIALSIGREKEWGKRTGHGHTFFEVHQGAIASGDKLLTTKNMALGKFLDRHYNDTLAVDMESAGFTEALARHENIKALCIRGISNLLDDEKQSDDSSSESLASTNVAAFTFELIYQLKKEDFPKTTFTFLIKHHS